MKKFLFICAMTLGFFACTEENKGSIEISLHGMFGDEAMVILSDYLYHDFSLIEITRKDIYISDITLIDRLDNEIPLSEIELFSLTDTHVDEIGQEEGASVTFENIDADSFKGIRFGIGVSPELNAMTPSDFPVSHPLSKNFWTGWESYIFTKTEGNLDIFNDGSFQQPFTYHAGTDELYREIEFGKSFTIDKDAPVRLQFEVDILSLLGSEFDFIDIATTPSAHTADDLVIATQIMDRYQNAFTLR